MFGLGTIINVTAIVAGGVMGLLFGKKLTERYQSNLMMASALCVLFIGVSGCMEQMLKLTENGLSSSGSMMMIACFAVGALLGSIISFITKGLDFVLTALFVVIFVGQWQETDNHIPAVVGVAVTLLCRIIFGSSSFLIPAMFGILVCLSLAQKRMQGRDSL